VGIEFLDQPVRHHRKRPRQTFAPAKVTRERLRAVRRSPWERIRWQLGGGLLFAVIIPLLLRRFVSVEGLPGQAWDYTPAAAAFGVVAGYWGFRKISAYPGVRPALHILPSFTLAFGAAVLVLFFGRLDYSRFLLLLCYVACIAWFYLVYFKLQGQRILTIGVVPCGDVRGLYEIQGVRWVELDEDPEDLDLLDAVVADLRADIPSHWERFLADQALQGKLVLHRKQIYESLTGKVAIDHLSENNFGSLVPGILYLRAKRAMDVGAAILALPFLAPILLLIGLAIRLDSSGPALFKQARMGHRGRVFMMYKFRTMTWEPEDRADRKASITRDEDSRITRVGRFLRKRRIDELPQVLNILRGEMSWIGPRPEAVALSYWYESELPFYRYRHIVPPGISGWAQVKQGHVSDVHDVRYKLHYDFYYIKNFSLWLDILIAASTLRIVLNGFGSR
jgi:lipopolysaccharide/colanic/teichoic acid biosynthesis glycosyltransferase